MDAWATTDKSFVGPLLSIDFDVSPSLPYLSPYTFPSFIPFYILFWIQLRDLNLYFMSNLKLHLQCCLLPSPKILQTSNNHPTPPLTTASPTIILTRCGRPTAKFKTSVVYIFICSFGYYGKS